MLDPFDRAAFAADPLAFFIGATDVDSGEITCPTKYFPEASSINFRRSCRYGFGVLWTSLQFRLQKWHLGRFAIFERL